MRVVLLLACGLTVIGGPARSDDSPTRALPSEVGTYNGTGRACFGTLKISADRIVWNTPFSQCSSSGFSVLSRYADHRGTGAAFVLTNPGPKCRSRVLLLTHDNKSDSHIGWNVTGFESVDTYAPEKPETGLSCYLVK